MQALPWERQRRSWDVTDELVTSLARQGRSSTPTAGRSATVPLPYDERTHCARLQLNGALNHAVNAIRDRRTDDVTPNREQWLLGHIERIRSCQRAVEVVDQLDAAVRNVLAVIDSKRDDDRHILADDPRLAMVDDALATRREILDAMPALIGQRVSSERFSMWVARGRLLARGDGRYRVGDVKALATQVQRRKAAQ